jgi:carboxymethylenebutenolidase
MSAHTRVAVFAIASVSTAYAMGLVPPTVHATQKSQGQTAEGKSWAGSDAPAKRDVNLPPDEDAAREQLAKSPRHAEWVDIAMTNGPAIRSFLVQPERKPPTGAGVVILIHEEFGLTEWIRGVADQLAKHGFIVIAPDLLSGKGPAGGGTDSLGDRVGQIISALTVDEVVARLNAVRDYTLKMPDSNGRVATIGFSWGGGMSLHYALNQPRLNGAVSFYGPIPTDPAAYSNRSRVPIVGLYGQADTAINENIPLAQIALGASFTPNTYFDAGHGFARLQKGQNGANFKATAWAWGEAIELLKRVTGGAGG